MSELFRVHVKKQEYMSRDNFLNACTNFRVFINIIKDGIEYKLSLDDTDNVRGINIKKLDYHDTNNLFGVKGLTLKSVPDNITKHDVFDKLGYDILFRETERILSNIKNEYNFLDSLKNDDINMQFNFPLLPLMPAMADCTSTWNCVYVIFVPIRKKSARSGI